MRLCDGKSALQRRHGGRREGKRRSPPPVRLARREQSQEGLERQLPLDLLLPQLPGAEGPGWIRHVVPGLERRPRGRARFPAVSPGPGPRPGETRRCPKSPENPGGWISCFPPPPFFSTPPP